MKPESFNLQSEPEQEKPSTVNKIVGSDEELNSQVEEKMEDIFENQEILSIERKKTPREIEIITEVLKNISEFAQSYGAKNIPMTVDHIHFVDRDKLNRRRTHKEFKKGDPIAFFQLARQSIFIFSDRIKSEIDLAVTIAHELIHAYSFNSITVRPSEKEGEIPKINPRRSGLEIESKDKEVLLYGIEEAVISELEKRFYEIYIKKSVILEEEVERTEEIRAQLKEEYPDEAEDFDDITSAKKEAGEYSYLYNPYKNERKQLHKIMIDIQKKFPGKFKSEEDVFKEFVKAHVTGRLLTLARLIDETYKDKKIPSIKGGYLTSHLNRANKIKPFRKLAENTKE